MASGKLCEHCEALTSDREGGKEWQVTEFSTTPFTSCSVDLRSV